MNPALFLIFKVVMVSSCLSKSFNELPTFFDENPKGWYKLIEEYPPDCSLKFDKNLLPAKDEQPKNACTDLPPELDIMQFGFSKYLDGKSVSPIYYLNCNNATKVSLYGNEYILPSNMWIMERDELVHHFINTSLKESINYWGGLFSPFVKENPSTHADKIDKAFSSGIRKIAVVRKTTYSVTTYNRASRSARFRYRELNDQFDLDMERYFKFVLHYGTDARSETYFGGLLVFQVTDETRSEDVLRYAEIVMKERKNSIIYYEGGSVDGDFSQWLNSLYLKPAPIYSYTTPIYDFMEPNKTTVKKASLKRIVDYVKHQANINYLINELQSYKSASIISDFMLRELRKVKTDICINSRFVNLVYTWIIRSHNMQLNTYYIQCTHDRWFWPEKDEEYVITRSFRLLPGLCFTKEVKFGTCVHIKSSLPENVSCILFYSDKNCNTKLFSASVNGDENLKTGLINAKSFAFCPNSNI